MNPGRILRVGRLRPVLVALSLLACSLAFAAPAGAHLVPSCGWVKPSLVKQTFGLTVRAKKARWSTKIAPVLDCNYTERQPSLQLSGDPIVRVEFREVQRIKPSPVMEPVKGLGSCRMHVSCPRGGGHQAAWIYTRISSSTLRPAPYTSGVILEVQTGLNMFAIEVNNPAGPLAVTSERAAVIRLARRLAKRFRYK